MTVVALLRSADVLYLGADSQWTDLAGIKWARPKLTLLNGQGNVIAWGTAGNPQIGVTEFGEWMKRRERSGSET
jgi:hypothetical protein